MEEQMVPQPQSDTLSSQKPYAGIIIRWAASIVDTIIVGLLSIPIFIITYLLGYPRDGLFVNFLTIVIPVVYSVVLIKRYQATWGKKFFRIKVQIIDGSQMTWMKAFLREGVGKLISSIVLCLGYIWAIFDKRKQTWHDKIAGTVVIQDEPLSKGRTIVAYILALGLPVLAIVGIAAVVLLVAVNPIEQLARTRDAGRKATVSQLGHAITAYNQNHNDYPQMTNDWITNLVSSGELGSVPAIIINNTKGVPINNFLCGGIDASQQNGFCYSRELDNAIVYTPLESKSENEKCKSNESAWSVYSTREGKSGTVCYTPQPGPQKFVD
jgi:uncharacterized RDD family membrane protein YckC